MSLELSQRKALLVLNGLPHVGPVMLRRLMDAFDDDAISVLSGQRDRLMLVKGVGDKVVQTLLQWQACFDLAKEEAAMETSKTRFYAQMDQEYPSMLKELYDSPIGLYWKGNYIVDRPCVAIVGTRR
ncbi:MAG: DNA-processing protein DprA, partial [Lentimonas sp.]